jgi:hypothetical protein
MTATKTQGKKPAQRREATNRPVHEVRLGRIRAAIWANSTETGVRHNVTLSRLYKDDKSGEWRDSTSFGRDDMPLVMKVCDLCHTWIYEHGNGNGGDARPSQAQ